MLTPFLSLAGSRRSRVLPFLAILCYELNQFQFIRYHIYTRYLIRSDSPVCLSTGSIDGSASVRESYESFRIIIPKA